MSEFVPWDEFSAAMKGAHREKSERIRARVAHELTAPDVKTVRQFNNGEHLRIEISGSQFDLWPATGRWRMFPKHRGDTRTGGIPAIRRELAARAG